MNTVVFSSRSPCSWVLTFVRMTWLFRMLRDLLALLGLAPLQILAEGRGKPPGAVIVFAGHGPALTSSEVSGHSAGLPESDRLP